MSDTLPGPLEAGRKLGSSLEAVADSVLLKVVKLFLGPVVLGVLAWFMDTTIKRLEKIETTVQAIDKIAGTTEWRLSGQDRLLLGHDEALKRLSDKLGRIEVDVETMKQVCKRAP